MRAIYWQLAATGLLAMAMGAVGGEATIAGMVAAPTRPLPPYVADAGAADAPINHVVGTHDYTRIAEACAECSDYDLGYRFAEARKVSATDQCMDFSWSYQRGCLAWLRDERA